MSEMSSVMTSSDQTVVVPRGGLPDAPMPMPAQLLEVPSRSWFSLLFARQPSRGV